MVIALLL